MVLKKISIVILKILGVFTLPLFVYLIFAFGLSSIPVNSDFQSCKKDCIGIYLLTNGVHADLVLPFKNQHMDWSKFVNPAGTYSGDSSAVNVAFGWGDKGFYLETKTWGDLQVSTAFNALFFLSSSAMHVTFYKGLRETESCKKIYITKEQYLMLVNYIIGSFDTNSSGIPQQIVGAAYWDNDSFYEAKGTYNLFFTCNTWVNEGLKKAGLRACLWTPFDSGLLRKYDQQNNNQ
jgi:uncharacterized protein (TIGR02117 family)